MESVIVGSVEAGSAAEAAGLKVGDTVLSVNGKPVRKAQTLVDAIRAEGAKPLALRIKSPKGDERTLVVSARLTPQEAANSVWKIGAVLGSIPETVYTQHGPE